jgi:hypothetical protein
MAVVWAAQHEMAREINFAQIFHSISRKGKESFNVHGGI